MKKSHVITWSIVGVILLFDQILKFYIKTHLFLGESIPLLSWFQIVFIENPGMAFGMNLGSKLFLTVFRLILSVVIAYYIVRLIRDNYKQSYISCIALIFAGAVGNIIDCLFYGVVFSESSPFQVAEFLPATGGYASFLQGKVVDMFYFPLFTFPEGVPFVGGQVFFSPVFNVADSAITVGIFVLLLFFAHDFNATIDKYLPKKRSKKADETHA